MSVAARQQKLTRAARRNTAASAKIPEPSASPTPSHSCTTRPIPAKAGISAPKGANCRRRRTNVQLPAALRRRRFLPSQEWDGGREWDGLFPLISREWRAGERKNCGAGAVCG
ncbi:MAG: hypothetical protein ACR2QC_11265 [Gammaproteobacteria bacterium]